MKIGNNNCNKSKKQRPCIYDLVNYVKLDRDLVNNIYRCSAIITTLQIPYFLVFPMLSK